MKWILLLLLCASASAQLPVIPFNSSGANPYCNFDFANGVTSASNYARFIGYSSTNFGGTTQLIWTNLSSWGGLSANMLEDTVGPIVTNAGPVTGLYSVDFSSAGYAGNHFMACVQNGTNSKLDGSNQPNTIFVVCTDKGHTGNGATLIDANLGSSTRVKTVLTSDGTGGYMAAGAGFLNTYLDANTLNWFIYTFSFNGSSSFCRTNGVKASYGGTISAQKFGWPVLGNDAIDNPGIAAYEGKVWAVLFYSGSMSTNDIISVERALNCQAGLGYAIPGP